METINYTAKQKLELFEIAENKDNVLTEKKLRKNYVGKFVSNIYFYDITKMEHSFPLMIEKNIMEITTEFKANIERFFPGKIIFNCSIKSIEQNVLLLSKQMMDRSYIEIITINNSSVQSKDLNLENVPVMLTNIKYTMFSDTLQCIGVLMVPEVYLNIALNIFPNNITVYGQEINNFQSNESVGMMEPQEDIKGGKVGKGFGDEVVDFYKGKFSTEEHRLKELFAFLSTKIFTQNFTFKGPEKIKSSFNKFMEKTDIQSLAKSEKNQTINFISDQKKLDSLFPIKKYDIIVMDGIKIEDIHKNIQSVDIFLPYCSKKYFLVICYPTSKNTKQLASYIYATKLKQDERYREYLNGLSTSEQKKLKFDDKKVAEKYKDLF